MNDSKNPTSSVRLGKSQKFNFPPESMKRAPNRMYLKIAIPIIAIRNPAAPMLENKYRICVLEATRRKSSAVTMRYAFEVCTQLT